MSETKNSNRRYLRNILVRPHQQLRVSFLLLSVGMIGMIVLVGLGAFSIYRTLNTLQVIYHLDAEVMGMAWDSMVMTFGLMVLLAVLLGTISFILGVKLTHRIFGPVVAFRSHIDQLIEGNYASRIRLRKGDELVEVGDALNELADHLEKRSKS